MSDGVPNVIFSQLFTDMVTDALQVSEFTLIVACFHVSISQASIDVLYVIPA